MSIDLRAEAVYVAFGEEEVDFAEAVDAEGLHAAAHAGLPRQVLGDAAAGAVILDAAQPAEAVVGEEVAPGVRRHPGAAVDDAPGHRRARRGVLVLEDW